MTLRQLTRSEIDALADTRHPRTGTLYPVIGLQPWYDWLINALHTLAESCLADYRVVADDASLTSVRVMPGRASIQAVTLVYPGGVIDLAPFNNDTALLWLHDDAGSAAIAAATAATGWPATAHIKLAEVALAQGLIVSILDRRAEAALNA